MTPESKYVTGPYRATKLWNDAVRSFHKGMPLSRHWRGLKQYDNCFTSAEAIDWLRKHLSTNPNFGPSVTREQILKLLRKFLKSGLLVEARGNKIFSDDLQDNRELLRFSNQSPLKALRTPRRSPLAVLNTNVPNYSSNEGSSPELKPRKFDMVGTTTLNTNDNTFTQSSQKENTINEEKDESYSSAALSNFTPTRVENAWRQVLFQKLQNVSEQLMVVGDGSSPLVPASQINPLWVKHNCLGKSLPPITPTNGLMQTSELPSWILTAMKSLANWPNSSDSICNIPNYPGVEMDIFKIVKDFFINSVMPLIPFELYDPIVRLYIGAEFLDVSYRSPNPPKEGVYIDKKDLAQPVAECHSLNDSVENLMLDVSVNVGDDALKSPQNEQRFPLSKSPGNTYTEADDAMTFPHVDKMQSTPQTLKLDRLKAYTNFKDSILYAALRDSDDASSFQHTSKVQSEERRTLKSLKNRARTSGLTQREMRGSCSLQCLEENLPDPFKKLLRTEELDNYALPPNSCFETAFTSDSPRTRIIPQKSVDTIHFRNIGARPKSIAVSSMFTGSTSNSCDGLESIATNNYGGHYHRSISAMDFANLDSNLTSKSPSLESLKSEGLSYFSKGKLKHSGNSKISLASRVRDSIKRRKEKVDFGKSKNRNLKKVDCKKPPLKSGSEDALIYTNRLNGCNHSLLRSKSGGYINPILSLQGTYSESSSIKSEFSDKTHHRSESGIGSSFPSSTPELSESRASTFRSDIVSQLDGASLFKKRGVSPMSSTPDSARECPSRCSSYSTSYTPNACLSHSIGSCVSNSMYLSALSELNHSTPYATLPSSLHQLSKSKTSYYSLKPSSPNPSLANTHQSAELEDRTPNSLLPDCLLVASPIPKINETVVENFEENLSSQKSLSCSANNLSDPSTDRTPYGRVPPYVHGGIWHHYRSSPSKRLIGQQQITATADSKRSPSDACLPGLLTKAGKDSCIEALQYIFLILEPSRRRKLRFLLRMMHKASRNEKLQLQEGHSNTRALMVNSFVRCILLSEQEGDYDEVLVLRIVTFLMDNYESILNPPQQLAVLVYRSLYNSSRNKENANVDSDASPITFCTQVSLDTYEEQKLSGSQKFLADLLDQIIHNSRMSDKEKRKKLQEFKTHYPEIYKHRYPDNVDALPVRKPSNAHRRRLKGLRKISSIASIAKPKSIRL